MGVQEGVLDGAAEAVERAAVHPFKCDFASASSEIIDLKWEYTHAYLLFTT